MIEAYVDESGNMGKEGDYFVLGATVVKNTTVKQQLEEIVKSERGPQDELKFSRMKAKKRRRVVRKIAETEVDVYYFCAYKPEVTLFGGEVDKNLIYNYFCRLLMRRVLKRYGDDFLIVFDKRTESAKPMYRALKDYIRIISYVEFPHLKHRKIEVRKGDSKEETMLQAADAVVGAAAQGYAAGNLEFLNLLGGRIMMMDEFPDARFQGHLKREVGKGEETT